jgi:hypothetical protein
MDPSHSRAGTKRTICTWNKYAKRSNPLAPMYPIFPSQPTLLPMFDVPLPTLYRRFHLKITLAESLWRLYRRRRFNPVCTLSPLFSMSSQPIFFNGRLDCFRIPLPVLDFSRPSVLQISSAIGTLAPWPPWLNPYRMPLAFSDVR